LPEFTASRTCPSITPAEAAACNRLIWTPLTFCRRNVGHDRIDLGHLFGSSLERSAGLGHQLDANADLNARVGNQPVIWCWVPTPIGVVKS
jgi:hypothetical protein